MKIMLLVFIAFTLIFNNSFAQLEISSGYAVNRLQSDGAPIHLGYDFKIGNKFYTKSQVGFKKLTHYNDFVETRLRFSILEFHQTVSYELIKKKNYIFNPNIGLNYRFYTLLATIDGPYNSLPQRAEVISRFRGKSIILNSYDGTGKKRDKRKVDNIGFSFQFQNQFKINKKIWLSITPFLEPDYDRTQNTGGCYVGVIFKQL